jgi:hypothetical protein
LKGLETGYGWLNVKISATGDITITENLSAKNIKEEDENPSNVDIDDLNVNEEERPRNRKRKPEQNEAPKKKGKKTIMSDET